jgi:hypothetical protein
MEWSVCAVALHRSGVGRQGVRVAAFKVIDDRVIGKRRSPRPMQMPSAGLHQPLRLDTQNALY